MEARRAAEHRRCHHAPGWLPCPLVMRVSRRLACGCHAHDPAHGTLLTLLVTGMQCVLMTFIESDSNARIEPLCYLLIPRPVVALYKAVVCLLSLHHYTLLSQVSPEPSQPRRMNSKA